MLATATNEVVVAYRGARRGYNEPVAIAIDLIALQGNDYLYIYRYIEHPTSIRGARRGMIIVSEQRKSMRFSWILQSDFSFMRRRSTWSLKNLSETQPPGICGPNLQYEQTNETALDNAL
jgi:hypothetical protein